MNGRITITATEQPCGDSSNNLAGVVTPSHGKPITRASYTWRTPSRTKSVKTDSASFNGRTVSVGDWVVVARPTLSSRPERVSERFARAFTEGGYGQPVGTLLAGQVISLADPKLSSRWARRSSWRKDGVTSWGPLVWVITEDQQMYALPINDLSVRGSVYDDAPLFLDGELAS